MGRNLADKVKHEAVTSAGAAPKLTTVKGVIWGKGHVLPDGSPAKGFYVDGQLGPVVQAVPYQKYKNWVLSKDMEETKFAAANMRLFRVILHDIKDFNEQEQGSSKYELLIDGDFHKATIAMPVVKGNTCALDATVPDGETLKRKSVDASTGTSPKDRVRRLKSLRDDDPVGASMFHNAAGVLVERPATFPAAGDSWYGGLKTNQNKGEVALYTDHDSSSKVFEADSKGVVKIKANDVQFDADFKNVSYGDFMENPLQGAGFSSVVTPIPRFLPKMKGVSWVSGVYGGLMDFFAQDDTRNYGPRSESATYDHEVIDVDSFRPNRIEE